MNITKILRRHAALVEGILALFGVIVLVIGFNTRYLRDEFYQDWWLNLSIDAGVALMAAALIRYLIRRFGVQAEQTSGLREIYPRWSDDKPTSELRQLFERSSSVQVLALSASNTLAAEANFTERLTERLKLRKTTQFLLASTEEVYRRAREEHDQAIVSKSQQSVTSVERSARDAGVPVANHLRRCPAPVNANIYLFDTAGFIVPLLSGKDRKQSPGLQLVSGVLLDKYQKVFDHLWTSSADTTQ